MSTTTTAEGLLHCSRPHLCRRLQTLIATSHPQNDFPSVSATDPHRAIGWPNLAVATNRAAHQLYDTLKKRGATTRVFLFRLSCCVLVAGTLVLPLPYLDSVANILG